MDGFQNHFAMKYVVPLFILVTCIGANYDPSRGPFGDEAFGEVATQGTVLLEWARQQGVEMQDVYIGVNGSLGHGLITSRPVKEGDILLRIPYEAAMSIDSARNSTVYGAQIRDIERRGASPLVILVLHLLQERHLGSKSKWSVSVSC